MLLSDAPVYASLPVVDLQRAKKFYQEKLGLKVVKEDPSPGAALQAGGGTVLYLYQRAATKADHTAASFMVKDFDATMKELRAKGVIFEEYNMPGLKTVQGVAKMGPWKGAWFKDTEGNILGLTDMK